MLDCVVAGNLFFLAERFGSETGQDERFSPLVSLESFVLHTIAPFSIQHDVP